MRIIGWLLPGLTAGFIGNKTVNTCGGDLSLDVILGIAGAVVGGYLFTLVGAAPVIPLNIQGMFAAAIGAVVFPAVYRAFVRPRRSDVRLARHAATVAVAALLLQGAPSPARADNALGYTMLTEEDAARLPRSHGVVGIEVGRAGGISGAGLDFEVMKIRAVRSGSAGQAAGLRTGDEIIAVDGRVFPSIAAFVSYIGSLPPGTPASFDTIPSRGSPAQARRVAVRVGPNPTHMSTGEKLTIGAEAAAFFGCYERGCFHHRQPPPGQVQRG